MSTRSRHGRWPLFTALALTAAFAAGLLASSVQAQGEPNPGRGIGPKPTRCEEGACQKHADAFEARCVAAGGDAEKCAERAAKALEQCTKQCERATQPLVSSPLQVTKIAPAPTATP